MMTMQFENLPIPPVVHFPLAVASVMLKILKGGQPAHVVGVVGDAGYTIFFKEKPRVLSFGVDQLYVNRQTLRVELAKVHVGPLSGKDFLSRAAMNHKMTVRESGQNQLELILNDPDIGPFHTLRLS